MVERIYTFEQVAEHLQDLVTVYRLKVWARTGQIETVPLGRGRGMNESQLAKLVRDGVPTTEQRRRPQPRPKAAKASAKQPKPVRQTSPATTSSAAEPLVFDRTRSRNYRAGGAA